MTAGCCPRTSHRWPQPGPVTVRTRKERTDDGTVQDRWHPSARSLGARGGRPALPPSAAHPAGPRPPGKGGGAGGGPPPTKRALRYPPDPREPPTPHHQPEDHTAKLHSHV